MLKKETDCVVECLGDETNEYLITENSKILKEVVDCIVEYLGDDIDNVVTVGDLVAAIERVKA